jgi:hypothetical protein
MPEMTKATTHVTIACKMPRGMTLRLFDMVDSREPVMGGGFREFKIAQPRAETVRIYGNRAPYGMTPPVPIVGGYALTPNVDAEFWAEWKKQNAEHDAVKNRLIFAYDKPESASAAATERAATKSGLEPMDMRMILDPKDNTRKIAADPRVPRRKAVTIETADSQQPV